MARDVQEEDIYTKTSKVEPDRNCQRSSSYYKSSTTQTYFISLFYKSSSMFQHNKSKSKLIITKEIANMLLFCNTKVMETHMKDSVHFISSLRYKVTCNIVTRYASPVTEQYKCWDLLGQKFNLFQTVRNKYQGICVCIQL